MWGGGEGQTTEKPDTEVEGDREVSNLGSQSGEASVSHVVMSPPEGRCMCSKSIDPVLWNNLHLYFKTARQDEVTNEAICLNIC